jgi:hypothetical protein
LESLDIYYEIRHRVDLRVKTALSHGTDWRLKNPCPSCTFELQGERQNNCRMLTQMDGNESLKRIERVRRTYNEDKELIAVENIKCLDTRFPNDYYMGPSEVGVFKDEVH